MSNLKYWVWLSRCKGLAGQNCVRVLEHFGSPEHAYYADAQEYLQIGGLPEGAISSLKDKSMSHVDRILGDCDRLGIRMLTQQDAAYPERLAAIHQPPLVLYMKGRPVTFDEEAAIAIVGTRAATPYGAWAAAKLSMDLTRSGALIISGMAEGIDASAVRGALKAGGPVVSVLAGGIDVIYPQKHRDLYEDVAAAGTLISENPPGTTHLAGYFPVRNRIISGLSVGVIAVESKRFGGTMHTIGHALDQNRDVFAVPGPIGADTSEGTNRLIQEGAAKLILDAEDVLCEFVDRFPHRLRHKTAMTVEAGEQRLNGVAEASLPKADHRPKKEKPASSDPDELAHLDWEECKQKLSDDQLLVLKELQGRTVRVDDLVEATQLTTRNVLSSLTMLQILGYVAEESGKRFRAAVRLKME